MDPHDSSAAPPQTSVVLYWIAKAFLWATGWRIESDHPQVRKAVVIAAPHTSVWDAIYMIAVAWGMRIPMSWMVKNTVFKWPFGPILRWLRAVPIDRRARHDTVEQIKQWFDAADHAWLAIAPSGTRSKRDHWKSGFYHMSRAADVPILLGYLDYSRKCGGIGGIVHPTGDAGVDMDKVRAYYAPIRGYRPELESRARLKSEDPDDAS